MLKICEKKAYASMHQAERVRQSVYKQRNTRLRIYFCPDCHFYHLTKQFFYENKPKVKYSDPYSRHEKRRKFPVEDN